MHFVNSMRVMLRSTFFGYSIEDAKLLSMIALSPFPRTPLRSSLNKCKHIVHRARPFKGME